MSCELAERLEAWGRDNVSHQEGPAWYEFMGLVSLVEELDERFTEERIEHSKLAAEVVAELRVRAERARKVRKKLLTNNYGDSVEAFNEAAFLVAEKLGVKETNGNP